MMTSTLSSTGCLAYIILREHHKKVDLSENPWSIRIESKRMAQFEDKQSWKSSENLNSVDGSSFPAI